MFQLIIAVIAIALVAALAIASIYYGGSAFQKSSLKAQATTVLNGAQQIAGAVALYRADKGSDPADIAALVTGNYLASAPAVPAIATAPWALTGTGVTLTITTTAPEATAVLTGTNYGVSSGVFTFSF